MKKFSLWGAPIDLPLDWIHTDPLFDWICLKYMANNKKEYHYTSGSLRWIRTHTTNLLLVVKICAWSGGVCLVWGVCLVRGVSAPGGAWSRGGVCVCCGGVPGPGGVCSGGVCVCSGGCLLRGVSAPGGMCLVWGGLLPRGVYPSMH